MPRPTETVNAPARVIVTAWDDDTVLASYRCDLELVMHLQPATGSDELPAMVIDENLQLSAIIQALRDAVNVMEQSRDSLTPEAE